MEIYNGIIKWFNIEKGYGFIKSKDFKYDLFFHAEQLLIEGYSIIKKGDNVVFQIVNTKKGLRAINIYKKE